MREQNAMREHRCVRDVFIRFALVFILGFVPAIASAAEGSSASTPGSEKAMKYHAILIARPEPGYLFDRFYNTWLDTATVDSLEAYLRKQADASQKNADRLLLAYFYAKKGDDVAALEEFRKALAHDPASAAT